MKCPNCDSFMKSSVKVCPNCGVVISKGKGVGKKPSGKGKVGKTKDKGKTGKKHDKSKARSKIIDKRGEEDEFLSILEKRSYGEEEFAEDKGKDFSKLAAVFMALSGIDAIGSGIMTLVLVNREFAEILSSKFEEALGAVDPMTFLTLNRICSVIMILFGCMTLVGMFFAFKKQKWPLCIILCVAGILSLGQFLSASILAVIALVLLILSRKHFQDFKQVDELPPPRL